MQTYSILVSGEVQGVFYRQSTKERARSLELKGTVQNTKTGEVIIVVTGQKDQVDQLVEWCKLGPPAAKVDLVVVNVIENKDFDSFSVIR